MVNHFITIILTNIFMPKLPSMKKITTLLLFLVFSSAFAQRTYDQYSLEASYGVSQAMDPSMTDFQHIDAGFRYMFDEYWGVKAEYGTDSFRTDTEPKGGTNYHRITLQGVYNVGRLLDLPYNTGDRINLLAHAGLGYSALKSTYRAGIDNIGHIIVGLTPQFYISDQIAIHADVSYVMNFTQHYLFDGTYPEGSVKSGEAFRSGIINGSAGITFYFGKNENDSDWR